MRPHHPFAHLLVSVTLAFGATAGCLLQADEVVVSAPVVAPAAPVAVRLDRETLLRGLTRDFSDHYALNDELQLDLIRPWVSPVETGLTVTVIEYAPALASSMLVRVRYQQGEKIVREDSLAFRAQLWREALAARVPVERGTAAVQESLETRRVDALRDRDALPSSIVDQDYLFTRSVTAGRLLTWRDVARRALVRKGEVIEVAAIDGTLQITMKALAMQDGARGENVRVRNLDSKRDFIALVTADSRAQVRF